MFYYAYTVVTPAMAVTMAGKGSDYAIAYLDSKKKPLDGAKTYQLHLPPDVPVNNFWAVTMYDTQTRSQLQTSNSYPSLGSQSKGMKKNPFASGGWNKTHYPKGLMDASVRAIPRPNNDTLYVMSMMDLRKDPVIVHYPAFDSTYVSLETSVMDHYVNIPLATSKGDFKKPTTILYYSTRTEGYKGEPVNGVDKIMEMSGDFAIAFLRVMPEATDPAKFKANMAAISNWSIR